MHQPRDRADVELLAHIAAIERLSAQRLDRSLPAELSAAQFGVLTWFARNEAPASPMELARAQQVTKGAMTNTLQRLEARGLIHLEADPADGRRKHVTLTDDGAAVCQSALAAARPQLEGLRRAFAAEEFEAALPFLRRLRAWLDGARS